MHLSLAITFMVGVFHKTNKSVIGQALSFFFRHLFEKRLQVDDIFIMLMGLSDPSVGK